MPELPEVETIRRRLHQVLPGKQIVSVEVFHPKSFTGEIASITQQPIQQVTRKAKVLTIELPTTNIVTHLKMTGQLIWKHGDQRVGGGHPTADWIQDLPSKHTRIHYTFDDGSSLFFNDQRLFGWMRVMDAQQHQAELAKYGPDIIDDEASAEYLYERFQNKRVPVKVALLDGSIVAGLGNIYVCDALNKAQISPFRRTHTLSLNDVERLIVACKAVVELGIELEGSTTDGMYVSIDGMAGGYQTKMLVYGREGEPCYNCGGTIAKEKIAGRGTYFCPDCQV